jgi:hypothetical protein
MKFGTAIGCKDTCELRDRYCSQVESYKYDDDAEIRGYIRKMLPVRYVKVINIFFYRN